MARNTPVITSPHNRPPVGPIKSNHTEEITSRPASIISGVTSISSSVSSAGLSAIISTYRVWYVNRIVPAKSPALFGAGLGSYTIRNDVKNVMPKLFTFVKRLCAPRQ